MSDAEFVPGVGDLELIGRGTTSSVFRGRDLTSGGPVIAKVLNLRLQSDAERESFDDAIESIERLPRNESLLEVVGHGINSAGHPWIITRFVPRNLAAELAAHHSVPWADAVGATARVAASLEEAHRRGIVHGDIRPKDIRIDERGTPVLADIGLSLLGGSAVTNRVGDARREHTAPEVIGGATADERTDVYALASVLYEMVSGEPPFGRARHQSPENLEARILGEAPAPLTGFGLPIPLDEVIRRALSKDPDARPSSAGDLATALERAAQGTRVFGDTTGVPASWTRTPATMSTSSAATAPQDPATFSPDDPTPVDSPYPEGAEVLAADEAAPLLAAAGRRERRRRRERRVLVVLLAVGVTAAVVALVVSLATNNEKPSTSLNNGASGASGASDSVPLDTALEPGPVVAEGYPFSVTFDIAGRTATISGVASPIGESRLKSALTPVGRVANELDVRNGPEPDDGAAVIDAVTLIAAMRRNLSAGSLSFDGRTFSISGFTLSADADAELRSVIALTPTPVDRPQFSPDPKSAPSTTSAAPATGPTGGATIRISAQPSSFTIPANGRFHILPITLVPSGSSTTNLCLASRNIQGPPDGDLTMNYSSCLLARLVTFHSAVPGTYTVIDTFIDESDPARPTATVTFTVRVT